LADLARPGLVGSSCMGSAPSAVCCRSISTGRP